MPYSIRLEPPAFIRKLGRQIRKERVGVLRKQEGFEGGIRSR